MTAKITSSLSRSARQFTNWRAWLRGLFKAAIEGGTTAALATLGSIGADAVGVAQALDYRQALTVGLSGAFVSILVFLKSQPLPEEERATRPPMGPGIVSALLVAFTLPFLGGCANTAAAPESQAVQVAKISAAVEGLATGGAAFYLSKNPGSAEYLLAAATVIEASANAGTLDPAAVQSALRKGLEGPEAQAAAGALSAAFGIYQAFVGANVGAKLDTAPAFKAALLALARGVRSGVRPVPAAGGEPAPLRIPEDLILR